MIINEKPDVQLQLLAQLNLTVSTDHYILVAAYETKLKQTDFI